MEIQACRDKMLRFETEENSECIKEHPGFNEIVFLNLYPTAQFLKEPGYEVAQFPGFNQSRSSSLRSLGKETEALE